MLGKKPKVAILGVTGMIGNTLYKVLRENNDLLLIYRSTDKLNLLNQAHGGVEQCEKYQIDLNDAYQEYIKGFAGDLHCPSLQELIVELKKCDYIINALGIIKPYCDDDPGLSYFVNGTFPQVLAEELGKKLIHITTDCAFNGSIGAPYDELAPKLPPDIYGATKALGEPEKAIVLRCSTIGPELQGNRGLLAWLISQKGKTISGYTNHWWNGIFSAELGKVCQKIVNKEVQVEAGVYHIFSDDITKHDLLTKLNQQLNLGCVINPVEAPVAIDRRLRTIKNLNQQLCVSSLDVMITSLMLS
ncbi:sugar nucleotide-binding protein [Patescibacteria group bacterium]|nr:sugar nucleotide-binding protein [Patescibacteria group bacterium]